MMRTPAIFLLIILFNISSAQWNPYAGVVASLTEGADLTASSGGSIELAIDGDNNTRWQSGNPNPALPAGYLSRADLNLLFGAGSTPRFSSSNNANGLNTTDGNVNSSASINAVDGKAWVSYDFPAPVALRTISLKCGAIAPSVSLYIYAYHANHDSTLIGTLHSSDNFALKRFTPGLSSVTKIKLISISRFSVFEVGVMSGFPTEYLIVDMRESKEVGYIETRYWSGTTAVAGAVYASNDAVNWMLLDTLVPDALRSVVIRPSSPVNARYVKIELAMEEVDFAKINIWEIKIYDRYGHYGPFPESKPHVSKVKDILGVNGLWGWGHNSFSNSIPQGYGPTRFNTFSTHARNYHNMHWDVHDPDDIPNYGTQPMGLALWWLDWNREYAAWKNAGMKVQASIQFSEWITPTQMANWDNPYQAAYNYGYAFARHFGPTHGNGLVEVLEVGNEPWTYPASFYLEVLRGMLHGAHAGDPALKLLPCALQAGNPNAEYDMGGNWLGARLTELEAPYIDGINVHHYSYTNSPQGTRIAVHPEHPESDMRGVVNDIHFRDANLPGKKIYLSEWGWDSDGGGEDCNFGECVSEHEQAVYAVRGAMMFMRLGIDRLTWYFFGNQASGNLYSRSGFQGQSPGFSVKKGLYAFQAFTHLIGEKHFLEALKEDDEAWVYLFGDSNGTPTHLAAWRPIEGDDSSPLNISLNVTLRPDSAWTIKGLNAAGEAAPLPGYAAGLMNLTVTSAPLIVKVTPDNNTPHITWTGNVSTNWHNPLNWNTYTLPTETSIVTIPSGRPHYPATFNGSIEITMLLLNAGGQMTLVPWADMQVKNSIIMSGGTLNVTGVAGFAPKIHIGGMFIRNAGAFNAGSGRVIFNGTQPQSISGQLVFNHLDINNQSSLTLMGAVSVKGVITVMTGSTLITNNLLTIESGGSLMHGQDTPRGRDGNVAGSVTVKRTGSANGHIFNYWSTPVNSANTNVLGASTYYYHPASAHDETEAGLRHGWIGASGIMQAGIGYVSQGAGTVSFQGEANSAPAASPVSVTVSKNDGTGNNVPWNLIGNPFPSAIDAEKFIAANGPDGSGVISGALYLWDDDGSGGSNYHTSDYAVWNLAGMVAGPNSGMIFSGSIASCQSFFVEKVHDGASQVIFDNSMRTTDNNAFFHTIPNERLWMSMVGPSNQYNETLIAFLPDATDSVDLSYDAKKIKGSAGVSLYSLMSGQEYAIQSLAQLSGDKTVPLGFKASGMGNHRLSLKQMEGFDETTPVVLEDKTLGVFTHLKLNPDYSFYSVAGEFNDRFFLHFGMPVEVAVSEQDCEGASGGILLDHRGNWNWSFTLADSNGASLHSGALSPGVNDIAVPQGNYALHLTDNFGYTVQKNIEVNGLSAAIADFNFAARGLSVTFTDASSGSAQNEWDFGDGITTYNIEQPHHAYAQSGNYMVTLRAWNDDCADERVKTVVVNAPVLFSNAGGYGFKKNPADDSESDDVKIFAYEDFLFAEFRFRETEQAQLTLFDLAGRQLYSGIVMTEGVQQIIIPGLPRSLYFAKVTTAEKMYSGKVMMGRE